MCDQQVATESPENRFDVDCSVRRSCADTLPDVLWRNLLSWKVETRFISCWSRTELVHFMLCLKSNSYTNDISCQWTSRRPSRADGCEEKTWGLMHRLESRTAVDVPPELLIFLGFEWRTCHTCSRTWRDADIQRGAWWEGVRDVGRMVISCFSWGANQEP